MGNRFLRVIGVLLVALLGVGAVGWWVVNYGNDSSRQNGSENIHLPKDVTGAGSLKPAPPVLEPPAPSFPATKSAAREALDRSFRSIKLQRVWDRTYHAVGSYQSRPDNADLSLKMIYLWEVSRLQGGRAKSPERNDTLGIITKLESEAKSPEVIKDCPYYLSYLQWYELLQWSYEDNEETWAPTGKAAKRIKALVDDVSPKWGLDAYEKHGPRHRMDGSVASVGMYVLISLQLNLDKVNYNVGERLDVSPLKDPIPANERKLVVLLDRLVGFIESCYGGKEPDCNTAKFRYGPNTEESNSLVGGKVLYFLSKGLIAEQRKEASKQYFERAFEVLRILQKDNFASLRDSYELAHVMKGITILLRWSAVREELGRTREIAVMADTLLARDYPLDNSQYSQHWSQFYLPIAYLNYYVELSLVLRHLDATARKAKEP